MVSLLGFELGFDLPTFTTQGWGMWLTIIAIAVLFILAIGILLYIWWMRKIYFVKIRDFENIAGQGYQLTFKDRARLIKVGDGGEEILYLRKRKTYRTAYGKKMGKNEYWFSKGQDGYWYNCVLGDLDAKMGMLDIEPIDRDMRYMHVAIRKNIQDRYRKKQMEKVTAIVVGGVIITVLIMLVGNWIILSKMGDLIQETSVMISNAKPIGDTLISAVQNMDKLCSGAGIRPA